MSIINSNNTNSTLTKNIHYFLQNGEKQIKYSPNKDIVLFLGNTGSGKSTLTQYISGRGHTLLSKEVEEGTGEYVIVDNQNKISSDSTIVSQTIYPDLVEDVNNNTIYYDCPGFSDTRSAAHEIAATYFIKKVIDSAKSAKLVFVVSHNSVSKGADRQDFILMLYHATAFIKEIPKFKNSIALVVTKIENRYIGNKIVSDEKVIMAIVRYLEQVKRDIDSHPQMVALPGQSSNNKEKVLSLLDIFLSRAENEKYLRIGIFRKPNEPGTISDIQLMKQGKISLENLINKNIQFVDVANTDFGYTVSAKSKVHISGLAEEINQTILKELLTMGIEVEEYCTAKEKETSDLEYLNIIFKRLHESFSQVQENAIKDITTPEIFINEIYNNLKHFKLNISDDHIKTLQREEDYINFLNLVTNQSIKNHKSSLLAAGLSNLTEYLNHSHSFFSALNKLYQRLSQYDFQKQRHKYNTIQVNELSELFESSLFKDVEDIFKEHSGISKIKLGEPKMKLLNRVLDQTLKYQIEVTRSETDKIVVKGMNVKLSDLSEVLSEKRLKFLEIYALHKVFIDTSLDLTGREIQMAIIAPVWEVLGNQSIILDGKSGEDHNPPKANSGKSYGESGSNGYPGEPGGPAGNFIGIGKHYIHEDYLHISANGGNGSRGQDGGDGSEGYDGKHCPKHVTKCTEEGVLFTLFYNTADAEYMGGDGGHGGNGGIGGNAGHRGIIHTIKVGNESAVTKVKVTTLDGHPGEIGEGGSGGKGGRYFKEKLRQYAIFVITSSFEEIDKWAKDGLSGQSGTNLFGRKETWKLTKLINLRNTQNEYKKYLLNNIKNNLKETFLTSFLGEIENNYIFTTQPTTNRKRRNIKSSAGITKPIEQLRYINRHKHSARITAPSYADKSTEHYYLDLNHRLNGIYKQILNDFFLKAESIEPIPSKPNLNILPILGQSGNMKTEKNININDQNPSINLYGNLLLSEMVLKTLMGKEISSNHHNKHSSEEGPSSAHDLAYRHYLRDNK